MLTFKKFIIEVKKINLPYDEHPFEKSSYSFGKLESMVWNHLKEFGKQKAKLVPFDKIRVTDRLRKVNDNLIVPKYRSLEGNIDVDKQHERRQKYVPRHYGSVKHSGGNFYQYKYFPVGAQIGDEIHLVDGHHRSGIMKVIKGRRYALVHVHDVTNQIKNVERFKNRL